MTARRGCSRLRHVLPTVPDAHPVLTDRVPDSLWGFLRADCGLPSGAFQLRAGPTLPEPARSLLVHSRDMTSTLAAHHGSLLRVEKLQSCERDGLYLREVFLRTLKDGAIVEYGVIVVAFDQFSAWQQDAIRAGQAPLGGLLHRFEIPFVSTPIGFFAIAAERLAAKRLPASGGAECFGRFNRLARESGEPLAWILEILPPS